MPQFGDWQDLTFDFVPVTKPYRDLATGERLVASYQLRDDVPTSVMVRVYGILDLEEKVQRASQLEEGQTPDFDQLADLEERRAAQTLKALAGIFHHSYPERSTRDWEHDLRTQFTDRERQELVTLFFTRSLVSRQPQSDSAPAEAVDVAPKPAAAAATKKRRPTGQGATRGKSGSGGKRGTGMAVAARAR